MNRSWNNKLAKMFCRHVNALLQLSIHLCQPEKNLIRLANKLFEVRTFIFARWKNSIETWSTGCSLDSTGGIFEIWWLGKVKTDQVVIKVTPNKSSCDQISAKRLRGKNARVVICRRFCCGQNRLFSRLLWRIMVPIQRSQEIYLKYNLLK